jgi:hypothetical protein
MRDEEVDTNHALLAENTIDRQRWPAPTVVHLT